MTEPANMIRNLPGANVSPARAIHERNHEEIVQVVNEINALNEQAKTAKKEERPDIVRAALRRWSTYQYLKWAIETFAEGKS